MNREEIADRIIKLREEKAELEKQLEAFDYAERLEKANKYLGKYFKEVSDYKQSVVCLYVYGIEHKNCDLKTVNLRYYIEEGYTDSFEIESSHLFNPDRWEEDKDRYAETTKEEFDKHYAEVMRRIELAVNKHEQ
jgi:3'-phosphoadenosine 5'-phosphosulfate sulfotransferase (PAPS reductase)/FAD synthetase